MRLKWSGLLMVSLLFLAPSRLLAQWVGPDIINRGNADNAYQITFLDPGRTIPADGLIANWRVWAVNTGDVKLQVFRPVASGFQLVGENVVTLVKTGDVIVGIPYAAQIGVKAGDVLAFRYNDTAPRGRVISFSSGGTQQFTNWPLPAADVPVGGILTTQQLSFGSGRTYSLNAQVVPYSGITVAGTITLLDCPDPEQTITFEFRAKTGGGTFKRKLMLMQNGAHSGAFIVPNVPKDTYDIAVKGYCWLQQIIPNVTVAGNVFGLAATLSNGDLNDDNRIDIADFGVLVNNYNAEGAL